MTKEINWKTIKTKELAGLISKHLEEDGIRAILVGGSCVTIYSKNRYMSMDLDYVSYEDFSKIEASLKKIGFIKKKEKHFKHPSCPFLIEFVPEPVAIGSEIITKFGEIKTRYGSFKLLRITDCIKDRLASFYHWDDRQSLNQALQVCLDHKINLKQIRQWSKREGFENKYFIFEEELKKIKKRKTL